jgi:hypothetical protein
MENSNINDYYANCRVSSPILYPDTQSVSFNGFAWSDKMGMIHEVSPNNNEDWQQWLGTQQ